MNQSQPPSTRNHSKWREYWKTQGMPWRTEPEITPQRQQFLSERRLIAPNVTKGIYPFREQHGSIDLDRADVEWLLATHESDSIVGPVEWSNEQHRSRVGLDLRGADLRKAQLANLPLACTTLSYTLQQRLTLPDPITDEQAAWSVAQVHGLGLARARLQGASLNGFSLVRASLENANLEHTEVAHADLRDAFIKNANFCFAILHDSILDDARIYDTKLNNADFTHTSCKRISILDAEAIGADFSHSQMDRAKLNRSHCEYAKFDSARLRHVYMSAETGQDAETVHLEGASFRKANLEGASLTGVVLSGSYLMEANLKGASFVAVQFVGATPSAKQIELISQWKPQEVIADLIADLRRGANLSGTRLNTHTRMTASVFTQQGNIGAYLDDIRWNGAQLADANWSSLAPLGNEFSARHPLFGQSPFWTRSLGTTIGFANAEAANTQLAKILKKCLLPNEARYFSYRACLCHRARLRNQLPSRFLEWIGSWILWATTGYGYKLWRMVMTYLVTLVIFTLIYWRLGVHHVGGETPLQTVWDSFLVSLSAIHGRTTFEQLGAWTPAAWTAAVESVCGIVIEALFVAMLIQRLFDR